MRRIKKKRNNKKDQIKLKNKKLDIWKQDQVLNQRVEERKEAARAHIKMVQRKRKFWKNRQEVLKDKVDKYVCLHLFLFLIKAFKLVFKVLGFKFVNLERYY